MYPYFSNILSPVRIGGGGLIGSLQEVATRVGQFAEQRQRDEEILANAPDEFLDPIMSTLMMDPVILPSSRTTVDRTTIARYLQLISLQYGKFVATLPWLWTGVNTRNWGWMYRLHVI